MVNGQPANESTNRSDTRPSCCPCAMAAASPYRQRGSDFSAARSDSGSNGVGVAEERNASIKALVREPRALLSSRRVMGSDVGREHDSTACWTSLSMFSTCCCIVSSPTPAASAGRSPASLRGLPLGLGLACLSFFFADAAMALTTVFCAVFCALAFASSRS